MKRPEKLYSWNLRGGGGHMAQFSIAGDATPMPWSHLYLVTLTVSFKIFIQLENWRSIFYFTSSFFLSSYIRIRPFCFKGNRYTMWYSDTYFLLLPLLKGYQGMVDGGECIELAEWKTVSGIIQKVSLAVLRLKVKLSIILLFLLLLSSLCQHEP